MILLCLYLTKAVPVCLIGAVHDRLEEAGGGYIKQQDTGVT